MALLLRGLIGLGTVSAGLASAAWVATRRQRSELARLQRDLLDASGADKPGAPVDLERLQGLPAPVEKYFRRVLEPGQLPIRVARLRQDGVLRGDPHADRWTAFEATQLVVPAAPGFVWDARVGFAPLFHVRVRDAYVGGIGSAVVLLASAVRAASVQGGPEITAGALHRYLAEAVWVPTALLPSDRLAWTAIDQNTALATLTDAGTTVTLEFRFNAEGEVAAIYTPARWAQVDGAFRPMPWEGHFSDYRRRGNVLVPVRGEVGWIVDGEWRPVWRARLSSATYETASAA